MLNNANFEAKLKLQYELVTSESQDANSERAKSENRSEIKRILNEVTFTEACEWVKSIQSEIAQIHESQVATSILASKDLTTLAELNFYEDLLNEVYAEVDLERKAFFDDVMDNATQSQKVELCEIIASADDHYNFDQNRLERMQDFLSSYYEAGVVSRLDQEKAKINQIIKSNSDEEVLDFLEAMFTKNYAPYYGNNSLVALSIRIQGVVARITNEVAQLDAVEAVNLFNKTLARIITHELAETTRDRLEKSSPNIDWKQFNAEILDCVLAKFDSLTKANRPHIQQRKTEEVNEQVVVAVNAVVVEAQPQQNAVVAAVFVPQAAVVQSQTEVSNAEGREEKPTDIHRNRVRMSGKRPPTRKAISAKPASQNDDNDADQKPSLVQNTALQPEADAQQSADPAPQQDRRKKAMSMYVGGADQKKMQQMLAAGAAASTLRSSASSSSSTTSLRNNVPQIDLNQIVDVITQRVLKFNTHAQEESLRRAIACVDGSGSVSQFFSHIGSTTGEVAYYNQLGARIENSPEFTQQLRHLIGNTIQNINSIRLH